MGLPDLLMPWARSIDPLDQRLGAVPAKLALIVNGSVENLAYHGWVRCST
jgi:hypothetical protein